MADEELVDYVTSAIKSGRAPEEIKSELLKKGWQRDEVKKAMAKVLGEKSPGERTKKHSRKLVYLTGLVVIILILGVTSYYIFSLWGEELSPDKCGNGVCDAGEDYDSCPSDCPQPYTQPTGPQTVSVSPSMQSVGMGDTVAVEIKVSNANDLYGFQFDIEYDPGVLKYEKIEEGPFLSNNAADTSYPIAPEVSSGLLDNIANTRLGPVGGRNGDGTLETITFTAVGSGTSDIKITNAKFLNSKVENVATTAVNGKVTVT